ncbi:sensor histidine kinase [Hydrogenophaga sp. BPS33]|uniref:sensor histidine kinase n=1 Tax=Hydrogenophaga sp. BPS33 TaxID=2651974 RepID=UPI0013203A46|nr:HAMP domain-containing sensor histidine kinase [Hydrogenophaga sp. BPS33]QHE84904.1 HAMP domain-containing histidine kinase [Hydrogenophaga sp. BPS33]
MLVDTQPATYQHVPASPEVRGQWISSQLIGVLMDNMGPSLLAGAISLPVLVYLMAGQANTIALTVWAVLTLSTLVLRYRLIGIYRLRHDSLEGPQRLNFIQRYKWSWTIMALLWGAPVFLTYQTTSQVTQFICGVVVLGHGLLALTTLSAYLPVFRRYTNALVLAMLAGLVWGTARSLTEKPDALQSGAMLLVLLLVFWGLLIFAGKRLHEVYRASFELQFSNQELIDSLTLQTRASLRAVATKNRFLASAAHDLRQPVHALSLYADWLATEPEMARDISPRILQSTRAINELFDSLFDLTRIDAGNYKVRLQHVDVRRLLDDLSLQFEPVAVGKSLRLRTHTRPTLIWSDPVVLRRILGNLISNALRHTHQGGVLVGLRHRDDVLMFEVWDTGVGIAREHQQAIFQEFFRVSQHQGTEDSLGLGLTIVSKLTSLMGYQLSLNSVAQQGSVFRVLMPAFTQREPAPEIQRGVEDNSVF